MLAWKTSLGVWVGTLIATSLLLSSGVSEAADHRDSPRLMANIAFEGNVDINDTYLFPSPSNKENTVIIVTFSPSAGVSSPATFHALASYEIHVQNTSAIADNIIFQFSFSEPDEFGRQNFQMLKQTAANGEAIVSQFGVAPPSAITTQVVAFGPTGTKMAVKGGGTVMAGLFDDPFFFDSLAFNKFVALAQSGATLSQRVAPFFPPNIPNNFFGNFNVTAIVLEVPTVSLQSGPKNTKFGYWARTVANSEQIDREGRPAVNTAAIPTPYKDVFNEGTPVTDSVLFTPAMIQDITELYGVSVSYALGLTEILLPDVLTIDVSKPAAFPNGRTLTDDVIDTEFKLLTAGALRSDRVDNDSVFTNSFPYLGAPQPRAPLP